MARTIEPKLTHEEAAAYKIGNPNREGVPSVESDVKKFQEAVADLVPLFFTNRGGVEVFKQLSFVLFMQEKLLERGVPLHELAPGAYEVFAEVWNKISEDIIQNPQDFN